MIKLIESFAKILTLKYGPYDNGHIMAGLSNGMILAFSSIDLTKLYQYKLFASPVTSITFDPTHYLIATSLYGDVAGITLIENKVKYVYVDLGKKKYCTVQMPLKGQVSHSRNISQLGRARTQKDIDRLVSRRAITPQPNLMESLKVNKENNRSSFIGR